MPPSGPTPRANGAGVIFSPGWFVAATAGSWRASSTTHVTKQSMSVAIAVGAATFRAAQRTDSIEQRYWDFAY
jgi:ADP-ribosylglycohydrolase